MAAVREKIKTNQTLAELIAGIIGFGILSQVIGAFFTEHQVIYAVSLWIGIIAAVGMALHMNYTIGKALDQAEKEAVKITRNGYLFRYGMVILLLGCVAASGVLNPLVTFLGIMGLKIGAYAQPLTHKIFGIFLG